MRFAGSLTLITLVACSDAIAPGPGGVASSSAQWAELGRSCPASAPATILPATARDSLPPHPANANAVWTDLARRGPGGIGGYYIDDGVYTIYLVDTSKLQEAADFLRGEGFAIPGNVVAKQARWDFAQLYDWYRYLNTHVRAIEGISLTDIQEAANRIEYGVIDESTRERVDEVLSSLEIPCFLVALEIRGYAVVR